MITQNKLYEAAKAIVAAIMNKQDMFNSFQNLCSVLSAHVAKETAPLQAEIDRLKKEVERLEKLTATINELKIKFSDAVIMNQSEADNKTLLEVYAGYNLAIFIRNKIITLLTNK